MSPLSWTGQAPLLHLMQIQSGPTRSAGLLHLVVAASHRCSRRFVGVIQSARGHRPPNPKGRTRSKVIHLLVGLPLGMLTHCLSLPTISVSLIRPQIGICCARTTVSIGFVRFVPFGPLCGHLSDQSCLRASTSQTWRVKFLRIVPVRLLPQHLDQVVWSMRRTRQTNLRLSYSLNLQRDEEYRLRFHQTWIQMIMRLTRMWTVLRRLLRREKPPKPGRRTILKRQICLNHPIQ